MLDDRTLAGADRQRGLGPARSLAGTLSKAEGESESVELIARQQAGWALAHIGAHLASSLKLTAIGIWAVRIMRSQGLPASA